MELTSSQETTRSRIYIEGHGCSASLADTEIITGIVGRNGYDVVEDPEDSDLSILVTCSVKTVTEHRMFTRIQELSRGGRKVVVAGCLAKAEPEKVKRVSPSLSMIGPENLEQILPAISSSLEGRPFISLESSKHVKLGLPRTRKNNVIGIVEISSGCLSSCTFCQVKLVKGTVFSYPEDQIVEEARLLISQGAREIWLTSTDNSAYGRDSKTNLASLIGKVSSLEGDFMIRVGMMNPLLTKGGALEDLVSAFQNKKVFKFLHLPVQSGSNRILKLMQRGYFVEDYLDTLRYFRSEIPDLTVSTDIIVGFPTETEEDFQSSMEVLQKTKPDVLNLSKYGARDGTKASTMEGQIPPRIANERSRQMTNLWRHLALQNNQKWIGWKGGIIMDEKVKNAYVGRNESYKPCLLREQILGNAGNVFLGKSLKIQVTKATAFTLECIPLAEL